MKKYKYILLLPMAAALLWACKDDGNESNNRAPECKITSPADGQTIFNNSELLITGNGSDPDNNIVVVRLTVGDAFIDDVTELPFEYTIPPEDLDVGELTISLYVKDAYGLSAMDEITVNVKSAEAADISLSPESLEFGYWSEERELAVITENDWTLNLTGTASELLTVYNDATGQWESKMTVSGTGNKTLRIKMRANELFENKEIELKAETAASALTVNVRQEASPDMVMMIEDANFRMAVSVSIMIYEADLNEDGKISAYEAETDLDMFGFDAGAYGIKTVKGIEYFPYLKHLDINSNPEITEVDLSGNTGLRSLHAQNCAGLKNLDLSKVPELIELGCNFDLYLTVDIDHLKENMHTLGILNRDPANVRSALDFSDFPNLHRLYVYDNGLTELNIEGCPLWLLSAGGNNFKEIDLSGADRDRNNSYLLENCPELETIYVWKGFTLDYYAQFSIGEGITIVEKE